jgi:flagellar basal body rod protein FlgF
MMQHKYYLKGGWKVDLNVDDDGHLTVGIQNTDGTKVEPMDLDIASNNEEWVERFTTDGIEEAYIKEQNETSTD